MTSLGHHSDADLLTRLNQGDRNAFEIIYRTYGSELYRYARHIIYTKEDCEEIVQDIFEKLWVHRKTITVVSFKAYLFGAVRNQILNYFKRAEVKRKYVEHHRVFSVLHESLNDDEQGAERSQQLPRVLHLPERLSMVVQ